MMYQKITIVLIISTFLLVGCTNRQENPFYNQLKDMYKISIDQVMNFRQLEESDMKKEDKIKKLVSACQEIITEVEEFQNIEVPKNGEENFVEELMGQYQ